MLCAVALAAAASGSSMGDGLSPPHHPKHGELQQRAGASEDGEAMEVGVAGVVPLATEEP